MDLYKLTKLNDCDGDVTKRWFAFYSFVSPDTNKFVRFRIWIPSKLITKSSRFKKYEEIKKDIDGRLLHGWSPFESERPELITLINALELYQKLKKNKVGSKSNKNYKVYSNRLKTWLENNNLKNIAISQFTLFHARNFLDDVSSSQKYENVTLNNYRRSYVTFFNFFIERELITVNPFLKIPILKEADAKIVAFTDEQWEIMSEKLPTFDPELWLIANIIYYAAIRPSEIMRLKIEDLDLKRQKITCQGKTSKNLKLQIIEIPDNLQKLLSSKSWDYPQDWRLFSYGLKPGEKETDTNGIIKRWRKFATAFDIKDRTIYNLKHNAAGRLIDAGFNPRDIQMHFRHSSLDQTEIYINKFKNTSSEKLKHNFPDFNSLKPDN